VRVSADAPASSKPLELVYPSLAEAAVLPPELKVWLGPYEHGKPAVPADATREFKSWFNHYEADKRAPRASSPKVRLHGLRQATLSGEPPRKRLRLSALKADSGVKVLNAADLPYWTDVSDKILNYNTVQDARSYQRESSHRRKFQGGRKSTRTKKL